MRLMRYIVGLALAVVSVATAADTRLAGVMFEGVSAYTPEMLLPLYRAHLGAPVDEAFLSGIALTLRDRYAADGYLPPSVDNAVLHDGSGVLVVRVQEPAIRKVNVDGREHATNPRFWEEVAALTREQPLQQAAVDSALQRMHALDGLVVHGSLVRDEEHPADYLLDLRVAPNRWSGIVHVDNRAPNVLGNELAQAQIAYRLGDKRPALLRAVTAAAFDVERLKFASVTGTHTVNDLGSAFEWSYAASESRLPAPNGTGGETFYEFERARTSGGLRSPLSKSASFRVDLWSLVQRYDVDTFDEPGDRIRTERIRSAELGASLTAVDANRGRHELSFAIDRGFDAFGAEITEPDGFTTPDLDYTRFELTYRLTQPFRDSWTFALSTQGQMTNDVLPVSERFLIGGRQLGGAFDPASVSGDEGFGARVEVARFVRVPLIGSPVEPYVYYDYGLSAPNDPRLESDAAASIGAGIRTSIGRLSTYLEVAAPVVDPDTNPLADDGVRVFFSVTQRFL